MYRAIDAVDREELARGPFRGVEPVLEEDADGVFEELARLRAMVWRDLTVKRKSY